MPVQRFAPMTKDFATFDCDAHVTEPPLIWERAAEFLTREELAALRTTIWWDEESRQLIVNGRAGVGIGSQRRGGIPGTMRVISNAGPGVKHDIQRALNVRNLNSKTALTQEQVGYIDYAGSYEPEPRLRDMDMQGIDQVMIIPTDIDTYPWLLDAVGAKAFCKAFWLRRRSSAFASAADLAIAFVCAARRSASASFGCGGACNCGACGRAVSAGGSALSAGKLSN